MQRIYLRGKKIPQASLLTFSSPLLLPRAAFFTHGLKFHELLFHQHCSNFFAYPVPFVLVTRPTLGHVPHLPTATILVRLLKDRSNLVGLMSRTINHIFRTLAVGSAFSLMAAYPVGVSFTQDFDNNPPGPRGGRGTNWENSPGPLGGPGASPNRRRR